MGTPTTKQKYFASYTDMKIETTATPSDLYYALQGLTDAQKSDIRGMGFESIMSFSIRYIPMGLGRWSLDNYDHKRNELKVGSHTIEVTPSKVHGVFGVPMGEIPVYEKKKVTSGDAVRNIWRKQFSYINISVKDVIEKLISDKKGGTPFKLNFLVLFNSIIGETTKGATVNHKFLSSIKNEGDISNMDWCGYIITCLKRTKEGWNGQKPYNGPLTFLAALYAHEQQLRRSPEKAITPAIQYVTTGFLIDFEGSMHVDGPCPNDNVQDGNHTTQNVEVQVKFETHIESAEGQTAVDKNVNVQQDEEDEVQLQTEECQTSVNQNVSVQQDKEVEVQLQTEEGQIAIDQSVNEPQDKEDGDQLQPFNRDSVLNLTLAIGPLCAQSLSASLVLCNRLEQPRDKKVQDDDDDDDDDVVILEPKQEQSELVKNVSHNSVEKPLSDESDIVCVEGYKVKKRFANILATILKKHGDIAAKCVIKTDYILSLILEDVCEVVMQIKARDSTERVEDLESQVSDAKEVNIDVSWLEAHILKRKEAVERYYSLMKMKPDQLSNIKAAESNLKKRRAELEAAEEQFREAKRRVEALRLVRKNLTDNFFESKAKMDSWVIDPIL